MRAQAGNGQRGERARGARPTVHGIPDHGGGGGVPGVLSGLWYQNREGAETAEQGTVQQTFRGCRWTGVRERCRATGSVAIRVGRPAVRSIDWRYLERWAASRRKPVLAPMGVDEIHLGKKQKFITVASKPRQRGSGVVWPGAQERDSG